MAGNPNTLTAIIPDINTARDVISKELVGFIPSVTLNAGSERAAVNQSVKSLVTPEVSSETRSVTMSPSDPSGQTMTAKELLITNDKSIKIPWSGEEQRGVNVAEGYSTIYGQQIEQAIRKHVNEIEAHTADIAYLASSRGYGTPTTTPFPTAGNLTDASMALKILKDNGQAGGDNSLVLNTSAGANFIGFQSQAQMAGTDSIRNQGVLIRTAGLALRESAEVVTHTAGAMASATTTASAQTVGQTAIPLATAGTGVVAAGDMIILAGDTNKYNIESVVFAGANPAAGDVITIAEPGLRVAQTSSAKAITVVATSARNIILNRSAVELVVRPPAMPAGGDAAVDSFMMVDPRSGLSFDIRLYAGYGMNFIDVVCVYQAKAWNPKGIGTLIG